MLVLDIVCAGLPFVPAVGLVRHSGKIDDALTAMERGLTSEKKVLDAEGLTKNTTKIPAIDPKTNKMGSTIPDAVL